MRARNARSRDSSQSSGQSSNGGDSACGDVVGGLARARSSSDLGATDEALLDRGRSRKRQERPLSSRKTHFKPILLAPTSINVFPERRQPDHEASTNIRSDWPRRLDSVSGLIEKWRAFHRKLIRTRAWSRSPSPEICDHISTVTPGDTPSRPRALSTNEAEDYEIEPSVVVFGHQIGAGAHAEVFQGQFHGVPVAIKCLKPALTENQSALSRFRREVSVMNMVRHPALVQFHAACTKSPYFIVCELLKGGTLEDNLHGKTKLNLAPLPLSRILEIAISIAEGMDHIHSIGLLHRDLKPANIMFSEDGHVKIADFGLSRLIDWTGMMTGEAGSYKYTAPEVLKSKPYDHKVDVYSFGVMLWEMVTGKIPYAGLTPIQAALKVMSRGHGLDIPSDPAVCPPLLALLITACLEVHPSERPSFDEIVTRLYAIAGREPAPRVPASGAAKAALLRRISGTSIAAMPKQLSALLGLERRRETWNFNRLLLSIEEHPKRLQKRHSF